MENHNRNSKSTSRCFFTLLSFLAGLILYIILKQKSKTETKAIDRDNKEEKDLNKQGEKVGISLTERQKVILGDIEKKKKIYPINLKLLLPNVSTRTIRRDMTKLVELKLIEQKGSTKSTYYTYIK